MLHTVKTTCAISALLVSFAATAHAANVVSDPYASYVDCSYGRVKSSGSSGCTVRGQQVTVSTLSQMMGANANAKANVRANNYNAISSYTSIVALNGSERGNVQYERVTERGADGKNREVKQLVFLVDNRPKGENGDGVPGGNVNERGGREPAGRTANGDIRDANGRLIKDGRESTGDRRDASGRLIKDGRNQPTASSWTSASADGIARAYKIELPDAVAARIEQSVPRKLERDEGVSPSSRPGSDRGATQARKDDKNWNDDNNDENWNEGDKEVVIPLQYASEGEIKAEEAKLAQAAPGTAAPGTVAPVIPAPGGDAGAVAAAPANPYRNEENAPLKVMILNNAQSGVKTIRVYDQATSEVIYADTVREDALVAYRPREAGPVAEDSSQEGFSNQEGSSYNPGENTRDQSYSGFNTTFGTGSSSGNQPEVLDKDNPESGRGGAGT